MLEAIFTKDTVAAAPLKVDANAPQTKKYVNTSVAPKSTIKKIVRKAGAAGERIPSISAALSGQIPTNNTYEDIKSKEEGSKVVKYGTTPFTLEQAIEVWNEFAEKYKEDVTLYNLLKIEPSLEGHILKVNVSNYVMEEKFRHLKPELIGVLSKKLNNSEIDIEISIVKETIKSTAITDDQKLKKMMSDNPAFMQMKNMFNLDFDG